MPWCATAVLCLCLYARVPCTLGQTTLDPSSPCQLRATLTPYAPLREADVAWERRVWRVIDLRDPANSAFRTPREAGVRCLDLFEVIRHGALDEGAITMYDPGPSADDDSFKVPMTGIQALGLFLELDTPSQGAISRFMIKEDWIFDKQRSVMEVRIIGLAPMVEVLGVDGELRGHRVVAWVYYPECRLTLARWAADRDAEGTPLSFEDLFAQRRFVSTIVKVSGMHDRGVNAYSTGLDALLEGADIKEQLFQLGFDLWNN
ncbi:MAG: gliding motility protein GldN [Flavobacteriales bacterium]